MIFVAAFLLALSIFILTLGARTSDKIMLTVGSAFLLCSLAAGFISYLALSTLT